MLKSIATGLLVLLLSIPVGAGPVKNEPPKGGPSQSGGAPPGRGWGPYAVKGTITAIDPAGSTFTLRVENALPAHGNPNAPGQQKKISTAAGTAVSVRVIAGQTLVGVGRNSLPFSSLVVGDRVQVWGAAQPDGTVTAVRVQLLGRARGPIPAGTPLPGTTPITTAGTVHGVIVAMGGPQLTLVTDAGTSQAVGVTAATVVRENGQAVGPGALHPYDIVLVNGVPSASTIDVEFDSATGTQVSGPVGLAVPLVEGITVGATIVGVHPDSFIIQGMTRLAFGALTPGRVVTIYGTPVQFGGLPFGLQARVIVVH